MSATVLNVIAGVQLSQGPRSMRVGVYVDAFNVYYGGRALCGRATAGWRWLDIADLAMDLIDPGTWPQAHLTRVAYCTAARNREGDPSSLVDQRTYIAALLQHTSALEVIYGKYVRRLKRGMLVDMRDKRPSRVVSPGVQAIPGWLPAEEILGAEGRTELRVSVATYEEKGSDVNVATALLIDVLTDRIDAAIVISNDSDLSLPVEHARAHVPVAIVNPTSKATARDLRSDPHSGAGQHWWRRLRADDFYEHQLPDQVGELRKPKGW